VYPTLDGALPIVGHLPEMYRRFPALCARGERKHGPFFHIHGGPGARQLMCAHPSALSVLREPAASTSFYADGFGALLSGTLFAFDGEEHRRVRGLMAPAFTSQRIKKADVLTIIDDVARAHLARWRAGARIEVLAATKEIALEIIFRIIGVPAPDLALWRKQFGRYLLAGVPRAPWEFLAVRARDWIDERLGAHVARLRKGGEEGGLVGAIARSRDEDGRYLDAALVVANLRLLVLAGHETTAASLAWNVLHLATSPADQARARDEAAGVADVKELAADATRFTFAEAQLREALRLYPAVHSVIRRMTQALDLEVGTIPAGALLNVPLVHLLRDVPEPARYLPSRWQARPKPGTLETAMFGGGPHFCLGYHIAIAEGTLFNLRLGKRLADAGLALAPAWRGSLPPPIYLPLAHPPARLSIDVVRA
jgi:cytochrome P450